MTDRVYVSVPMNGQPGKGLEVARMAEQTIEALGSIALLPHNIAAYPHDGDCPPGYSHHEGHSSACWLRMDILEMLECVAVVFGPGWEHSIGCRVKMQVAAACGMPIYWFDAVNGEITSTTNDNVTSF